MELQQYIEAAIFILSDLIIFFVIFKYYKVLGAWVTILFLSYAIYSSVFYLGILGLPYADQLLPLVISTEPSSDGTLVPTVAASVVGILGALTKSALAIGILIISNKLITKRSMAPAAGQL